MSPERTDQQDHADPAAAADARTVLRRRQTIGIVLIAMAILAFTLWRADWRGIFPPGWWRW